MNPQEMDAARQKFWEDVMKLLQDSVKDNYASDNNNEAGKKKVGKPSEPFPCQSCDKVYKRKGALIRHDRLVHQNHKPFKCPSCIQRFSEKCDMEIHFYSQHSCGGEYKCDQCLDAFTREVSLSRHMVMHHNMPFEYPKKEEKKK